MVLPALPWSGWCIINGWQLQMWFGTLTHTCTAPWGMVVETCCLQGRQPSLWGRSPVSFKQISQPSFFSQRLLTWFGTFTLCSAASWGMVPSTCHLQGRCFLVWGRSPASLAKIISSIEVATSGVFARAPNPWKVSRGGWSSGMWLVVMCASLNYCPNLFSTNIGGKNQIWNFDRGYPSLLVFYAKGF